MTGAYNLQPALHFSFILIYTELDTVAYTYLV